MRDLLGSPRFQKRFGILAGAMLVCAMAHYPAVAADSPQKSTVAPTAAAATWQLIDKNLASLESQIQAGKIGSLGSSAYGIADAFKTLSEQSASLPADKLAGVQGSVKIVGGLVSKLDKAGEHNDPAGVQSNLKALKATLAKVREYYPH